MANCRDLVGLIDGDADKLQALCRRIPSAPSTNSRHLLAARLAPGRPEIDDQHLALPLARATARCPSTSGSATPTASLPSRLAAARRHRCAMSPDSSPAAKRQHGRRRRVRCRSSDVLSSWMSDGADSERSHSRRPRHAPATRRQLNQDFLAGAASTGAPGRPPGSGQRQRDLLRLAADSRRRRRRSPAIRRVTVTVAAGRGCRERQA